jgi:hypothetical protein
MIFAARRILRWTIAGDIADHSRYGAATSEPPHGGAMKLPNERRCPLLLLCLLVLLPVEAYGQQSLTVAALLAKGGRQLNKDEIQSLVSGATVSGTSMNNSAWTSEYSYKSDGTMTGIATRTTGRSAFDKMAGHWSVRDDGQLCTERAGQVAATQLYCDYYFALDGEYYAARSLDGAALLVDRSVRR